MFSLFQKFLALTYLKLVASLCDYVLCTVVTKINIRVRVYYGFVPSIYLRYLSATLYYQSVAEMSPPTLDQFLAEIAGIIKEKNGIRLQEYLIYEPPLPLLYNKIVSEIKQVYPPSGQKALENKCISFIPEYDEGEDGGSRTAFVMFMVKYFAFLRDVNTDNLIETHDMLKTLLKCVAYSLLRPR